MNDFFSAPMLKLTMKRCGKCKEYKPQIEFGKSRSCKDGLCGWCLECCRRIGKARKWEITYKGTFEKYNFQCVKCGTKENLQIHHLRGRRYNNIGDLTLVCYTCHMKHYHGWKNIKNSIPYYNRDNSAPDGRGK